MAVLLHNCKFKNIKVEFLKVSEKNWSLGLPDIGARKSWDFRILTVSASTERKVFIINLHERMLPNMAGIEPVTSSSQSGMHPTELTRLALKPQVPVWSSQGKSSQDFKTFIVLQVLDWLQKTCQLYHCMDEFRWWQIYHIFFTSARKHR